MKLVRFELADDPGTYRSGIFHDGRVYETDGENAIGVHELSQVYLASPIGIPSTVRLFAPNPVGEANLAPHYVYYHPRQLHGVSEGVEPIDPPSNLQVELRIAAVLQEGDAKVDPVEAGRFVLGYALMAVLIDQDLALDDRAVTAARDIGGVLGPVLVTPEELVRYQERPDPAGEYRWPYKISVNEHTLAQGEYTTPGPMSTYLGVVSRSAALLPGDVIAWPPLDVPDLASTALGRSLVVGDRIAFEVEGMGILDLIVR